MLAVIPAAGFGERLRPLTSCIPKALIPVAGIPVIERIACALAAAGVDRLCLVVGHLAGQIEDWADRRSPLPFETVRQESVDGLAAAVLLAARFMSSSPVMVVLGDTVFDRRGLEDVARAGGSAIGVGRVSDPSRYGVVIERDGAAARAVEKPDAFVSDLAICGAYRFRSGDALVEALERLVASGRLSRGEYQLTDAIGDMIAGGERFALPRIGRWFDCGTPASILEANRALLSEESRVAEPVPGWIRPPVFIGVGTGVTGSVVGPNVSLGADCRVSGSRLSNLVACDGCSIEDTVLDSAILAPGGLVLGA